MQLRSRNLRGGRNRARTGGVLVLVAFTVTAMSVLAVSVTAISRSSQSEQSGSNARIEARCQAEAGIAAALFDLSKSGTGAVGSQQAPISYAGGTYWVTSTNVGTNYKSLVSTSQVNHSSQRVQLVVKRLSTSVYQWGTFGDQGVTLASNARV